MKPKRKPQRVAAQPAVAPDQVPQADTAVPKPSAKRGRKAPEAQIGRAHV